MWKLWCTLAQLVSNILYKFWLVKKKNILNKKTTKEPHFFGISFIYHLKNLKKFKRKETKNIQRHGQANNLTNPHIYSGKWLLLSSTSNEAKYLHSGKIKRQNQLEKKYYMEYNEGPPIKKTIILHHCRHHHLLKWISYIQKKL